jgi:two-component sensor histidine kinase
MAHSIFRLPHRLGFGRINKLPESLQREERLRFTAHELGHRTKNLLAVVQAIATQTGRRSVSLNDFQTQFSQRLSGLSRSVDLLIEEDGHGTTIADLVRSQLEPFGAVDGIRIAATGPTIWLNPEATRNIGLALHELATNACKHGALSVPEGGITVDWELRPGDTGAKCFRLVWREHHGPDVMPPTRRGFGHVVLQRMTGQALRGQVKHEFGASGATWTLEVAATNVVMLEDRFAAKESLYRHPIAWHPRAN